MPEFYGRTNVTYTPNPGFTGIDSFTYQVLRQWRELFDGNRHRAGGGHQRRAGF